MFYIGLDLGQRRDHTAIVVAERRDVIRAYMPPRFEAMLVRHVERVPLGTPYVHVVARIQEIVRFPAISGKCALVVDGTGVGAPIVEMLRAARLGCDLHAITITGGDRQHSYYATGGTAWTVPKQDLIAGVQVLLERKELKFAKKLGEAGTLVKELVEMKASQSTKGKVRYGADGAGEHDDLVIALALACWRAKQKTVGHVGQPLPGLGW